MSKQEINVQDGLNILSQSSPIINIEHFNADKLVINNIKPYNVLCYNLNDLYNNVKLLVLVRNCNIIVDDKNNILSNNTKLTELRNNLDNVIKKYNINNDNDNDKIINKNCESVYAKLNFNKSISKAYLKPSKKSNKSTVLVKNKEDF